VAKIGKISVMNEIPDFIEDFVSEQKNDLNVLGVILFGSWARGNNRPDSDVDLVVIWKEGFRRSAEERKGRMFEIIYTTEKSAFEFWENNKNDGANLWSVAKILYDKDGDVEKLKEKTNEMLQKGKKEIDEFQKGQFRFDAEDQLKYAEYIYKEDQTTANLILNNKVFALTELYFDLRQEWTPAPKQRLNEIKNVSPEFHKLLEDFYNEEVQFTEKLKIAKNIVSIVFE
jgi:predicted nucleotidyltransferase